MFGQQAMQPKTLKEVALSQEVRIAVSFIQEGLICLNRLDDVNDFVYLPLLLLSTGFERLLKVIICLDCLADKGQFPDSQHVRKTIKTHNLECLLKKVIIIANNWKFSGKAIRRHPPASGKFGGSFGKNLPGGG